MIPAPEPDAFEKRLRFGCGFVFGGFVTTLFIARKFAALTPPLWMAIAGIAGVALLAGYLAMRYGDDFWRWLGH